MNEDEYFLCRLCADLKPNQEIKHQITEDGPWQDIVKSLCRYNVQINLNDNNLPKMACITCVESLQQAFDFISAVERAQSTLNDLILELLEDIQEKNVSDDENLVYEGPEDDENNMESDSTSKSLSEYSSENKTENSPENATVNYSENIIENSTENSSEGKTENSLENETEKSSANKTESSSKIITETSSENEKEKLTENTTVNATENSSKEKPWYLCTDVDILSQVKTTWKDYEWLCSYCETLFPTIEELHSHSMQYHKVCNPYQCTDCNSKIFRLNRFLQHVKRHRNELKFSCYKCHRKFLHISETILHMAVHKKTIHICSGCNENFKCQEELAEHTSVYCRRSRGVKTVDNVEGLSIEGDSLTCTVCNKTFGTKRTLINHMWIHSRKQKEYICETCGKSFYLKGDLARHMIQHSDARPHQCELCKKTFKSPLRLRLHSATHNQERPFSCDQCGKRFRSKKLLKNHSVVHTDSFPHVCSYCNKGFRIKTHLIQHLRQHTGDKPYSCNICQREFTNWPNCNKHMKRRHNTDMAKTKRTPQGALPIDPITREVIYDKTFEEKSKILEKSNRGKRQRKTATDKGNDKNSDNESALITDLPEA
uniref:Protein krueppel n=1 Tax=Heliothis virescens TaxID=7102 RepID=A0A2A4IYH7_HELVI